MEIWFAGISLVVSLVVLLLVTRRRGVLAAGPERVPDRVWHELQGLIPEADYNYLRATEQYMAGSSATLVARLGHIGAIHDVADPLKIRLTIMELRIADMQQEIERNRERIPTEYHIAWVSVAAVSTVSSLVALVFFLLQGGLSPN